MTSKKRSRDDIFLGPEDDRLRKIWDDRKENLAIRK